MDTKKSQEANALLRLKAEEFLKKNPKSNSLFASEEDIMRLLHELEVHQIELQMQNEELYKAIYHAEELAELAAEKYYELYAFSTSGYFTLSADFEIIELNHRGAKMLGKERSNLIGNHFGLFVSKNSLDVFQVFFSNVFKSKVKETCEITLEVKGCKRQYVYVEGFVGEGDKCLLNVVDITQRKLVEQELAYEKNRLADILEGTNVGTWEWNVKTGVTIFNERWAGMLGYTLAEISPTNIDTWIKFTHPDDLEVSNELLNEHFERKTDYYKCEARMKHKDGYWVWVLDRGRVHKWDEDGKPLLMSGTHQDVTERKLVEAELEESREKYRGLSEASFEAIFISEKGKCIEQNLAGEKMFGYTTEEALTRYGTEWIAPEYRDMVMNNMLAGHENPYEAVA